MRSSPRASARRSTAACRSSCSSSTAQGFTTRAATARSAARAPQRWSNPASWCGFGDPACENPVVQIYNIMLGLRDPITGRASLGRHRHPAARPSARLLVRGDERVRRADAGRRQRARGAAVPLRDRDRARGRDRARRCHRRAPEGLPGPDRRGGRRLGGPRRPAGCRGLRLQRRRRDRHEPGGARSVPRPRPGLERHQRPLPRARGRLGREGSADPAQRRATGPRTAAGCGSHRCSSRPCPTAPRCSG